MRPFTIGVVVAAALAAAMLVAAAPAAGFEPSVARLLRDRACADVIVCAHRGNGAGAPENSLAAIRQAAALGALVIEVDVRETRDDVLILMHDDTLDRTVGVRGRVRDRPYSYIREFALEGSADGEPPPTLAAAFEAARGRAILQLDLKTDRMDLVARALGEAGPEIFDRVMCGKGSLAKLVELKRLEPRVEVIPRAGREADLEAMLAPELAPVAVQVPDDLLVPAVVERIRGGGARVWANALGFRDVVAGVDAAAYDELIEGGADIIQTDRPAILVPRARRASLARYPW